jgi:glyoxylase-like metal-dependent hydrolase (beta-lactamase superfamily II)
MKNLFILTFFTLAFSFVAKAQKPTYKVYAIRFAESTYAFTAADWAKGAPKSLPVKINFMVWLIKGSNGRNVLVDAGFYNDSDDAKEFQLINYHRPDSALLKTGIKPGDVTDIILSHPHWDHINGIDLFLNARVWMQKEDYNYFVGAAWQKGGDKGGFAKRDVSKIVALNLAGKLTLVNGDNQEIIPGIKVYTGSKHTYNSQYVGVKAGSNQIVLASDNVWIYYNSQHLLPANGGTLNPAGYVKAMQRMKTLVSNVKYIIPGHDAQVFSRFPQLTDGVVEIR